MFRVCAASIDLTMKAVRTSETSVYSNEITPHLQRHPGFIALQSIHLWAYMDRGSASRTNIKCTVVVGRVKQW
jgi:hypothetical protein